jgi:hypothetical protein
MPPAFATATDKHGGHAPAIGARRMGIVNPYLAQNSSARSEGRECLIVAPSRDSPAVVYINIYPVCKTRRAALETANAHRASFGSIQVAMPTFHSLFRERRFAGTITNQNSRRSFFPNSVTRTEPQRREAKSTT